eukprot:jgi/Psemu1/70718/estExt_Genemark1.C_40350001
MHIIQGARYRRRGNNDLNRNGNRNRNGIRIRNSNNSSNSNHSSSNHSNHSSSNHSNHSSSNNNNNHSNHSSSRTTMSMSTELLAVRAQVDPDLCPTARKIPAHQYCGITQATKCVDSSNWLEEYYQEIHANRQQEQGQEQEPQFLALSVGCNKGFDALNTLRMGTNDAGFKKDSWRMAMDIKFHKGVCKQDQTEEFQVLSHRGEARLRRNTLGYKEMGLRVVNAAVSDRSGTVLFANDKNNQNKTGIENIGIENCKLMDKQKRDEYCTSVPAWTLQEYAEKYIDNTDNNTTTSSSSTSSSSTSTSSTSTSTVTKKKTGKKPIIHHLSIDVEGYDADVLHGAGTDLLSRVEYLEFEYNWMGSWRKQHLYDVVSYLDGSRSRSPTNSYREDNNNNNNNNNEEEEEERLSFTCYWAGQKRLWRITHGCWMRYYDIHTWANVACVNRRLVPKLAAKMEDVFRITTINGGSSSGDGPPVPPFRHAKWDTVILKPMYNETRNDPMLVTEPHEALISTEYL